MKKNLTEIVFILDRSGSMSGLEADTIGGFNSMIEKQRKADGEALVSTVLFDNMSEVIHDRVNIHDIKPMTDRDYTVRGCTALLDTIGGAIHHIGNVHKYARPEDVPEHKIIAVLCISDIHAVCTPFIGSLCGKLLTGTNTPFAMSSARMAAFLASISAFFRFLILSSYRFCAPLAFRFK